MIQGKPLPKFNREQPYTYLGYEIRIDDNSNQIDDLLSDFEKCLDQIDVSLLPSTAKLEAINIMCMSKINFYFPNLIFLEKHLMLLEDLIVGYARHWLSLNNSSTRAFFFTPQSKGGLGLINPKVMYYGKHMAFVLSVLNSNDAAVFSRF